MQMFYGHLQPWHSRLYTELGMVRTTWSLGSDGLEFK